MNRRRADNGFTLIEVLVSLAILAISLGVLIPVFSASVGRQLALADQKTAGLLAQSKLDAIGTELPLVDGASDGTFANGFAWHLRIEPYPSDWPNARLIPKLATVTVQWPRRRASPSSLTIRAIRLVGRE